jgi:predicted DNA-binding protein
MKSDEVKEKHTKIVNVRVSEQIYQRMKILDEMGIKTISEFLREGLNDRVDEEFEKYLKRRDQVEVIKEISQELTIE